MSSVDQIEILEESYDIVPAPNGKLDHLKFVSEDNTIEQNTTEYTSTELINAETDNNSTIFKKITRMIKNIRYLYQHMVTEENIFKKIYPVGSIYISASSSFNPNRVFTGTTWEKIDSNKYLRSTGTASNVGKTGGSFTFSLKANNIPPHPHTATISDISHYHNLTSEHVTVSQNGKHRHQIKYATPRDAVLGGGAYPMYPWDGGASLNTDYSSDHTHSVSGRTESKSLSPTVTISSPSSTTQDVTINPPYYYVYIWRCTAHN